MHLSQLILSHFKPKGHCGEKIRLNLKSILGKYSKVNIVKISQINPSSSWPASLVFHLTLLDDPGLGNYNLAALTHLMRE